MQVAEKVILRTTAAGLPGPPHLCCASASWAQSTPPLGLRLLLAQSLPWGRLRCCSLLPAPPGSSSLTPPAPRSPLPWAPGPTAWPGQSTATNDPGESGWALATCLPSLGIRGCLKRNTCSLAIVTKNQKREHF